MQTPPLCVTIHMQHAPRHCKIYGETKRRCVLKKDVFLSGEQLHEKAGKGACIAQGTLKDSNDIHSSQCVVCVCLLQYSGRERETRLHRMHASSFLSYSSTMHSNVKSSGVLQGYFSTFLFKMLSHFGWHRGISVFLLTHSTLPFNHADRRIRIPLRQRKAILPRGRGRCNFSFPFPDSQV